SDHTMDALVDHLTAQNRSLEHQLAAQTQLIHVLDAIRHYSALMMDGCKCDQNQHIVTKLSELLAQHKSVTGADATPQTQTPVVAPNDHHLWPQLTPTATTAGCGDSVADNHMFRCDECHQQFDSQDVLTIHVKESHHYFDANTSLAIELKVIDQNSDSFLDKLKGQDMDESSMTSSAPMNPMNVPARRVRGRRVGSKKSHKGSKWIGCEKYQCNECFNWLPSETALETHRNKYHNNSKPFACVLCGEAFFANLSLLNHLSQTHHMSAFACNQCDYKTRTKHHLIQHMITHSMDRPFKCYHKGCDKSFKRKFELIRHNFLHKKRFLCKECNERFKDNTSLLIHLSQKHK
ncbi:unnamed protein product, partial [Oppiella nova]